MLELGETVSQQQGRVRPSVRVQLTSTGLNSPFLPKQGSTGCAADWEQPLAHTVLWRISVSLGISIGWDREHGNYGLGLLKQGRKRSQQFIYLGPTSRGRCLFKLCKGILWLEKCHSLVSYLMRKPAIVHNLSLHCCVFTPCEPNKHHRGSQVWIIRGLSLKCDAILKKDKHVWSLLFFKAFWTLVKQTSPICVDDTVALSHTEWKWWRYKSSDNFENIYRQVYPSKKLNSSTI